MTRTANKNFGETKIKVRSWRIGSTLTLLELAMCIIVGSLVSCGQKRCPAADDGAGTGYSYSHLLRQSHHEGYCEVEVMNPWKEGAVLHKYFLIKRADSAAVRIPNSDGDVVYTPVNKAIVGPSSICQLLVWLNSVNKVVGVCDADYINIPEIQARIESDAVANCGSSMQPSMEIMAKARPQAILLSSFENSSYQQLKRLGAPVIECVEYMETSALARAEWMKFYGQLFGKEKEADKLFNEVRNRYNATKAMAHKSKSRPKVLTERVTSGTWYCPGGRSTMASLLSDANAQYAFDQDTHSGSLPMAPEAVISKNSDADFWLFVYSGDKPLSKGQLLGEYHGYSQIKAFRTGNIFQCNNLKSRYFDEVSFRPDYLLADFVRMFHPELNSKSGNMKLRYYSK